MSITNAFFEETKRSPIELEKKYGRLLRKLIGILKWCKSSFDLPKMFSPWLWPFQKHNFWSISSENSGKISEKTRIGFISEDTAQIELVKKTNLKRNGILQYDMHFCQHQNHHNKDIPNYRFSWFSTFSNFCPNSSLFQECDLEMKRLLCRKALNINKRGIISDSSDRSN